MADDLADLLRSAQANWTPPPSMTIEAIRSLPNEPRVWLEDVIVLMTIGVPLDRDGMSDTEWEAELTANTVRRGCAAVWLFQAAGAAGRTVSYGCSDNFVVTDITPTFYDTPRNVLGAEESQIILDFDRADNALITAYVERTMGQRSFSRVRFDRQWIVDWLIKQVSSERALPAIDGRGSTPTRLSPSQQRGVVKKYLDELPKDQKPTVGDLYKALNPDGVARAAIEHVLDQRPNLKRQRGENRRGKSPEK